MGLSSTDVLLLLAIGLVADLGWGFLARLAVTIKERREVRRVLQRRFEPLLSVIVPCHNSEGVIDETLASLLDLDYERKQIVVVDDSSTDSTYERALKYSDRVTVVRRTSSTGRKTGAINYGLNFARGSIVVVVDDDTLLRRDSLRQLLLGFVDEKVGAISGNVKVKAKRYNVLARLQSAEYLVGMELARPFQNKLYHGLLVISGCFGGFRRKILEKVGEYDQDIITEDLDVTWKIYKLRQSVAYCRGAVCHTDVPTSVKALYRQRLRWDKGLFEVFSKHRNIFFNRRFGAVGLLLLPETLFTEVAFLFLRPAWLIALLLLKYPILPALLLTTCFYILLEFVATLTAGLLSDSKRNALKAFYAPMMFVYRNFLAVVRFAALVGHITGRKMRW